MSCFQVNDFIDLVKKTKLMEYKKAVT